MTEKDAADMVTGFISQIQEWSGRDMTPITPSTCPIGGPPGFDSLNAIELTVMVSKATGIENVKNLCVSKDGTRAFSLAEIAAQIVQLATR